MHLFAPDNPRPIHFMGIAGAGMSALALIASRRGIAFSGCDSNPSGAAELTAHGAAIHAGHDPAHVATARAVVYTAAVPVTHPELEAARERGIPVVRRADALAELVRGGQLVAVAGTHGKTTVTAMTVEALVAAGLDPTGLVGGRVASWHGNARFGGDDLFVVEADEYDRAFLSLAPSVAVVNNVEADHLECYGSVGELEAAFVEFAGRADRVLVGADDKGAVRVAGRLDVPRWLVGTGSGADVRIGSLRPTGPGTESVVRLPGGKDVRLTLQVPGFHNARNAAMALGVVHAVGGDPSRAARGLRDFVGVGRRFELLGEFSGVTVIDDYAHHPSEVVATLAAARQRFPSRRLIAVFQPHLYSRTKSMGSQLGVALSLADVVIVTAIFGAREEPMQGVDGRIVERAARRAGAVVEWVPRRSEIGDHLEQLVTDGDVVLTLGAGDITDVGHALARRLGGKAA